jgi:glutaredoxin 3
VNSYSVNRHYFVWVKHDCEWCEKAMDLLNQKSISYTVFTMDEQPELLKEAKNNFNWETIPIIFEVCSSGTTELIGGFTDLEKHLEEINDYVQVITNQTK